MSTAISPAVLQRRLVDLDCELALLDVRERGVYANGHLLFAASAPLSRLEIDAPRMVPRRATPILPRRAARGATRSGRSRPA